MATVANMSQDEEFENLKQMLEKIPATQSSDDESIGSIDVSGWESPDWIFDTSGLNSIHGYHPTITIDDSFSMNPNNTLSVDGNIVCKDKQGNTVDVGETLSAIQKRLAILTPDPEKLQQWEALREAYDHYKSLEALIGDTETDNDD